MHQLTFSLYLVSIVEIVLERFWSFSIQIDLNFSSAIMNSNHVIDPNSSSINNFKSNDRSMFRISTQLTKNENFKKWKFSIQISLWAKKKIGFIDGTTKKLEAEGNELDD